MVKLWIEKFGWKREKCEVCNEPAVVLCSYCGVLCQAHYILHRHKTGHNDIVLINWQESAQPIQQKGM